MSFDYSQISPGVRGLVRELREVHGFETCDSGDGTHYSEGMEGALPIRHVAIRVDATALLAEVADEVQGRYPSARVEASYSPGEPGIVLLFPDGPYTINEDGE